MKLRAPLASILFAGCASAAAAGPAIQDCPQCPRVIEIAPGSFMMGDAGMFSKIPVHKATIGARFALGETEVTRAQFRYFLNRTGYVGGHDDDGRADGQLPMTGVDWHAARAYVRWLSRHTGQRYRLPLEGEWEYAARGGTGTRYWWGDRKDDACGNEHFAPVFYGLDDRPCKSAVEDGLAPVASLRANPWGLFDMLGNADEWMGSCLPANLGKQFGPVDGCAGSIQSRTVRRAGDGYVAIVKDTVETVQRSPTVGFRVVRELP